MQFESLITPRRATQLNYNKKMKITKVDDNQIKVVKTTETTTEHIFRYEQLVEQKEAIQKQQNEDNENRDQEIVEIDVMLAKCEELDVGLSPTGPIESTGLTGPNK